MPHGPGPGGFGGGRGPGRGPGPGRGFGPRPFGPPPPPRRYGCCLPGCCTFVLGAVAVVGGLIALLCAIF